jgi:hypothetical protein
MQQVLLSVVLLFFLRFHRTPKNRKIRVRHHNERPDMPTGLNTGGHNGYERGLSEVKPVLSYALSKKLS